MNATSAGDGPILVCFDGSGRSRDALRSAARILGPRPVVVLTVWESVTTQIARYGGFSAPTWVPNGEEADGREESAAQQAASDGAADAQEQGFEATARTEQATSAVWQTIVDVADDLDAALILCGNRGHGGLGSALLGSTSHSVLRHAGRPVLVAPDRSGDDSG